MSDEAQQGYSGVQQDNRVFRRGLVLGLTLAEISILVIFILLLAFGALLSATQDRIRDLERELPAERASKRLLQTLAQGARPDQDVRDMAKQLIAGAVRQDEVNRARKERDDAREQVQEVEDALDQAEAPKADGGGVGSRAARELARHKGASDALDAVKGPDRDLGRMIADARTENQILRGSLKAAARNLERASQGKGMLKPSCWATREGKTEYIFDVTMTPSQIMVVDRRLSGREREQALLPLPKQGYGSWMSGAAFQVAFKPVFDWGEARGCRFYVRLKDLTPATDKLGYKRMLIYVESRFYRLEVNRF